MLCENPLFLILGTVDTESVETRVIVAVIGIDSQAYRMKTWYFFPKNRCGCFEFLKEQVVVSVVSQAVLERPQIPSSG